MQHTFDIEKEAVARKGAESTSGPAPGSDSRIEEGIVRKRVKPSQTRRGEKRRVEACSKALMFVEEALHTESKGWSAKWMEGGLTVAVGWR